MPLRSVLITLFTGSVVAWLSWALVIANVDPNVTPWWGFGVFYITLGLALFGTLATIGIALRIGFKRQVQSLRTVSSASLRQAFLWTVGLIVALALQSQRVLTWWIAIVLIAVIALIELIGSSRPGGNHTTYG